MSGDLYDLAEALDEVGLDLDEGRHPLVRHLRVIHRAAQAHFDRVKAEAASWEPPRPAEIDPRLVAAFMAEDVVHSEHHETTWEAPAPDEARRMATVAQARIDAAVTAGRARILGKLRKLLDGVDLFDDYGVGVQHAIDVVNQDSSNDEEAPTP